jgi:hypothetical protein
MLIQYDEDSKKEDEDEEFPELAAAARAQARQREPEEKSPTLAALTNGLDHKCEPLEAADAGPNPIIDILVWSPIEGTAPLLVKRKWNQNFRDIRKAWLQRQADLPEQLKKDVYFTWRNKRVFDVASCRSLGIKLDQYGNALIPSDQGPYRDVNDRIVLCATTDARLKAEKEAEAETKEREEEEPRATPVQPPPSDEIRVILRAKGYSEQKIRGKPVSSSMGIQNARF